MTFLHSRSKESYIKETKNIQLPIFNQPWWLDVACEDQQWDVFYLNCKNYKIFLPFYYKQKIFNISTLPPFTPKINPIIIGKNNLELNENEFKQILNFISKKFSYYNQSWEGINLNFKKENIKYRFYLKNIKSYVVYNININKNYVKKFSADTKRLIRKARDNNLGLDFNCDPDLFYSTHVSHLLKRGRSIFYKKDVLIKIYKECLRNKSGKFFLMKDKHENIHSGAFVVWDAKRAYLLCFTSNIDYSNAGGSSLLIHEILAYLSDKTQNFDFEGGDGSSIGKFYSNFTKETVYLRNISYFNNMIVDFLVRMKLSFF
tara:strand:- start:6400 stop:7350 length:951 start_codon:yes stop_codon:yes gene_type:complete